YQAGALRINRLRLIMRARRYRQFVFDAQLIAAKWYLGELSGEEMPAIACLALALDYDGKSLRQLAGLGKPTRRDIEEVVDGALRELGVDAPVAKRDAAGWMALRVARKLVAGETGVIAASRELAWLGYNHEVEPQLADVLLTFTGINSETDTL